jgi:uncharacterized protein (TIGR00725 family)
MGHCIGVIGPGDSAQDRDLAHARTVGRLLAHDGHTVLNGGMGGVMAAVSQGAALAGGLVVGYLPGWDRAAANPHLTVALPTGLGELRNGLLVRGSDAIICIGGSWGTLSEVAMAVRTRVPLVMLDGWELGHPGPVTVATPEEAVAVAVAMADRRR